MNTSRTWLSSFISVAYTISKISGVHTSRSFKIMQLKMFSCKQLLPLLAPTSSNSGALECSAVMHIKTILDFLLGFCGLFCLVINKLLALNHRTGYEKQKRLMQFVLKTSSISKNSSWFLYFLFSSAYNSSKNWVLQCACTEYRKMRGRPSYVTILQTINFIVSNRKLFLSPMYNIACRLLAAKCCS